MKKQVNFTFEWKKFYVACIPLIMPVLHGIVFFWPDSFPLLPIQIFFFLIFLEQTLVAPLLWFLPASIYEYGMLIDGLTHVGVIVVGIMYSILIYVLLSFPKPRRK